VADEVVSWEFRLMDQVSANAEKMEKSLEHVEGQMHGTIHSFHDLEEMGEKLWKGLEKLFDLGKEVFEMREWKEQTLIGLRAITGSADAAEDVFRMAEDFAIQAGQSVEPVVDAAKPRRSTHARYSSMCARVASSTATRLSAAH